MRKSLYYKDKIRKSGLKKKFIAEKMGVSRTFLYYLLEGKRGFNDSHVIKLNHILNIK